MVGIFSLTILFFISIVGNAQQDTITDADHGTFTDARDGQVYKWVKIGDQVWMAENLNFRLNSKCICYKRLAANCDTYGRLYSWKDAQITCPIGWHLPDAAEWTILIDYLGGESIAGGKMKETGTLHWNIPNACATNSSGFSAVPSGAITFDDEFIGLGFNAFFWTSSKYDSSYSLSRELYYGGSTAEHNSYHIKDGLSIRCVKDD